MARGSRGGGFRLAKTFITVRDYVHPSGFSSVVPAPADYGQIFHYVTRHGRSFDDEVRLGTRTGDSPSTTTHMLQ